MAHKEQKQFCKHVRSLFPEKFRNVRTVDVGSLDINGTIISTECLEHDRFWKLTLKTMFESLAPEGLLIITCAGDGRNEHGTTANHPWCSPGTNDYYMNITNEMFSSVLRPTMFQVYHLSQQRKSHDLQFYGIRKSFTSAEIYQKLLKTQNETL